MHSEEGRWALAYGAEQSRYCASAHGRGALLLLFPDRDISRVLQLT